MAGLTANPRVSIGRCGTYELQEVLPALREAAELAGNPDVRDKTVLLKPNILFDTAPEKACTTHPVFLEAAILLMKELGARRILVGDSPGLQPPGFKGRACGLGEVCVKTGAEWVDFTREKMDLPCPGGRTTNHFTVSAVLKEADYVISLPKLKTHQLMFYTGAMKNLFGLVPSLLKSPYHVKHPDREDFAAMIVDLNGAVMGDYALMDAVIGMEGPGPGSGDPRKIGLVLASANLLALDIAASTIIGYPPLELPVTREALARKIWLEDPAGIEYPALRPEEVLIKDFVKIPIKRSQNQLLELVLPRGYRKFREALAPLPVVLQDVCIRCGNCVKICSPGAMAFSGGDKVPPDRRVTADYEKCIRCYCCHEICPVRAIEIKKPGLRRIFVRSGR